MATIHNISAEMRGDQGKGASRRLRRAGKVPGVIYGSKIDPVNVQLEHLKTLHWAANEWFYAAILDMSIDGKVQKVLLRDMQRHPYKAQITHLDFQRVSENEAIKLRVPLHFLNQEKSIAGKTSGVVITHELNDVAVLCLPKDLPEFLEVDLSDLKIGDIMHLSEIKLPAGVSIPELKLGKVHDVAIVIAKMPKIEEEVAPAAAATAAPAKGAAKTAAPAKAAAPAKTAAPAAKKK